MRPVRKVSDWCRSHPLLTSLAALVAFFLGVHFFLNWQAERRWQHYCTEARARGVKLTVLEYARPEIPDEENFAALPMLQSAFVGGSHPFALPARYSNPLPFGNAIKGERLDWAVWQNDFKRAGFIQEVSNDPIRDTLRALDHYTSLFQEWSEWPRRRQCRFTLDLKSGFEMTLPHLSTFQDAAKLFSLRMRAHLALRDSAAAYADFREGLQAYKALREEPLLITGLVRISVLDVLVAGVGDGLMDHTWAEEDLRKIQADFAAIEVWNDYRLALGSERGSVNYLFDFLTDASGSARWPLVMNRGKPSPGFFPPDPTQEVVLQLVPKRVFRDNQLRQNLYINELLARIDSTGRHFDPDRPTPSLLEPDPGKFVTYYYALSLITSPVYSSIERKYLRLQTLLDQARIACALERFRQARGFFPATLDELEPEFMHGSGFDNYARSPYHYQRDDPGSFRLYSVGPDRHDDGGKWDPEKPERNQSDDIWLYAPPGVGPAR